MTKLLRLLGNVLPSTHGIDYRVVGRLHKRGGFSDKPIFCANGFRMIGATSNASYVSGVNERRYLKRLASSIRPGATVYNIGANTGYTALWLAQHFERKRHPISIVAFEPDSDNFSMLEDNVALNPALDITCENSAVGDFDGGVRFSSQGSGDGSAHIHPDGTQDVRICALDKFQVNKHTTPDWLVIDVEGYGGECLTGAWSVLTARRVKVALEVHSTEKEGKVNAVMNACNYNRTLTQKSIWGRFDF